MDRTWLVLDVSYLGYRALFSTGGLAHHGDATGVVFGILRDLADLCEQHGTTDVVFAFDHGRGLREQKYPWYKESRRTKVYSPAEEEARDGMRLQVAALRTRHLPALGYENVLYRTGYEADDIIAAVCNSLPDGDRAIVVSADKDLYQLLSRRVALWNPHRKELFTAKLFKAKFGIPPADWVKVKALSGCVTDDVPGAAGVGDYTACKFLTGRQNLHTNAGRMCTAWVASDYYRNNLEVVTLPYPGLGTYTLVPSGPPDPAAWRRLCDLLGFRSLTHAFGPERDWACSLPRGR